MRTSRAKTGPFAERLFFEEDELESIALDALRDVALVPDTPSPVRIDRFIEKRFSVVPAYEPVAPGVLGYTRFGPDGAAQVVVSRELSEERTPVAERRERSTLAHEAGHILLHSSLFAPKPDARPLFDVDLARQTVLCRDHGSSPAYDGRWWEYQANQMIGPLLLPRELAIEALRGLTAVSALGVLRIDESQREVAARRLSRVFDVNPTVARHRITRLIPPTHGQLPL